MTMINKEMKAAELASVTGGGWKQILPLELEVSVLLQDLLEHLYVLVPTTATWILLDKKKGQ